MWQVGKVESMTNVERLHLTYAYIISLANNLYYVLSVDAHSVIVIAQMKILYDKKKDENA